MQAKQVSSNVFKETMARVASSVSIVTTRYDGAPVGVTVSSLVSLSLEPPLVLICLGTQMFMPVAIQEHGGFAVNILSTAQRELALRFAGMLPDSTNRFAGVETRAAASGSPIILGCLAWLDCDVWNTYDGGDHVIIVGDIQAAAVQPERQPLL